MNLELKMWLLKVWDLIVGVLSALTVVALVGAALVLGSAAGWYVARVFFL